VQPFQFGHEPDFQPVIQTAERFVEQDHLRIGGQRPGNSHALALSAAEHIRLGSRILLNSCKSHQLIHTLPNSAAMGMASPQAEGDVLENRQMRKERVTLKDQRHGPPQ